MIRDRITQLITLFTRQIYVSRGSVLLGRETNAGEAQEIIIGDGLTLSAGTLSAEGGGGGSASVSDSEYNEGTWDAVTGYAPSKNAVRDKFVSVDAAIVAAQAASQPLDSDLTAIAALTTDAFGRVLLTKTTEQEAREYIGSEHLTRTAAQGPPIISMTVSGNALDSVSGTVNGVYELSDELHGKPLYTRDGSTPPTLALLWSTYPQTGWHLSVPAGAGDWYSSAADVPTPNLATGWTDTGAGTGTPVVTASGAIPDHIGQLCRVGDAAPYDWYRADTLTSWVPVSIAGSPVAWNATQSVWQKLVISGASGSEQIAITTI